jgi:hypothetical protein
MTRVVMPDSLQVTMPVFDISLVKASEEMAKDIVETSGAGEIGRHHLVIKGGMCRNGKDDRRRRLFAVGSIQTKCHVEAV